MTRPADGRPRRLTAGPYLLLLGLLAFFGLNARTESASQEREYARIVILADPHLPGRLLPLKQKVIQTINGWGDVDAVTVLGDITEDAGTVEEYAFPREFFAALDKPLLPIAGNHDYIYDGSKLEGGRRKRAPVPDRQAMLQRFRETFGLPELSYTRTFGRYFLVFLSTDDLHSPCLTTISSSTLGWLQAELGRHRNEPTLIFFHGPLKGTIKGRNAEAEDASFIAQPEKQLRTIIRNNPQIFIWAAGHMHLGATNARFNHPVNRYQGQVTTIHNCDLDGRSYLSDQSAGDVEHGTIWTNSLYLYPDRVVVRTYNHLTDCWVDSLTREIKPNPVR